MKVEMFQDYVRNIEDKVNNFFDENPKIHIIDIKQSFNNNGSMLIISIFYKNKRTI